MGLSFIPPVTYICISSNPFNPPTTSTKFCPPEKRWNSPVGGEILSNLVTQFRPYRLRLWIREGRDSYGGWLLSIHQGGVSTFWFYLGQIRKLFLPRPFRPKRNFLPRPFWPIFFQPSPFRPKNWGPKCLTQYIEENQKILHSITEFFSFNLVNEIIFEAFLRKYHIIST